MAAKKPVYVATTYTDKKSLAPGLYLTSDLYNFKQPLDYIVGKIIKDGVKTGVVPLEYGPDKAIWTQFPSTMHPVRSTPKSRSCPTTSPRKDQGDQEARCDPIRMNRDLSLWWEWRRKKPLLLSEEGQIQTAKTRGNFLTVKRFPDSAE